MKRVFIFIFLLVFSLSGSGWAADIYVSPAGGGDGSIGTPTDLQSALDTARTNVENDTIYLQTGTYDASTTGAQTFEYGTVSNDNMAVTLSGGWNSGYTTQSNDPLLTMLDGGSDSRVLEINAGLTGVVITFAMENLTIQNGLAATGGGIYAYTGVSGNSGTLDLTIDNCLIRNNTVTGSGGGMYTNCYFEIYDSTFSNNSSAAAAGAMIIYDVPGGDQSLTPIIENTDFDGNSNCPTCGSGGSAILNYVSPVIVNSTFTNNTGAGSPITTVTNSFLTISECVFSGNDIYYWGSAIHFWAAGGDIANCLIVNNIAGNTGSGYAAVAYYDGGSARSDVINIINSTFSGNSGDSTIQGAIYNRGAILNITNSIFWDNEGTSGLYSSWGTATISYSDVHGGVPGSFVDGGNNINSDPTFVGSGDYHITAGSQCIDSGDNSATNIPATDLDGSLRILDGDEDGTAVVDMGAYELCGVVFTDVPSGDWAEDYIKAIFCNGITTGCGGGDYCPDNSVTRKQMAAFIIRAVEGDPAADYCGTTDPFPDVPYGDWACKYIKRLVELAITTGCGGGDYCPDDTVTRKQMAAFIIRAVEGEPAADYCGTTDPFPDVPYGDWACKYIKRLVELSITTGCGGGDYCPDDTVTRKQMAAFLARAFLGMP